MKKALRCVISTYQFPTMNVIIMRCKHVLTKTKIIKTKCVKRERKSH